MTAKTICRHLLFATEQVQEKHRCFVAFAIIHKADETLME